MLDRPPEKLMKIIGIDPGSVVTGYGVIEIEGSKINHVLSGVIKPKRGFLLMDRLWQIGSKLESVIETTEPTHAGIENIFYGKNIKTAVIQAHARGVALAQCGKHRLKVQEFSPTRIKRDVTGNGKATKEEVAASVRWILNLKSEEVKKVPLDETDALAIAITFVLNNRKL